MSKIAVIKTGGKQYTVKEGQNLKIERLNKPEGDKVKFDTLLVATTDGKEIDLGQPLAKKQVEATVIREDKADKVSVVKYKNKTRYQRNKGHRQYFTEVKISAIV